MSLRRRGTGIPITSLQWELGILLLVLVVMVLAGLGLLLGVIGDGTGRAQGAGLIALFCAGLAVYIGRDSELLDDLRGRS